MERVPAASFPFEQWALEVGEVLRNAGLDAGVASPGPRAFQVTVPEEESEAAGRVLEGLGYLTCAVAPAMAGPRSRTPRRP